MESYFGLFVLGRQEEGVEVDYIPPREGILATPGLHPQHQINQVWCYVPVMLTLERWGQKDQKLKGTLSYLTNMRPAFMFVCLSVLVWFLVF